MTIFEVVDSAGNAHLIDAQNQFVGEDAEGRMRHDFVGVNDPASVDAALLEMAGQAVEPVEVSFTNPRSVREVPA